MTDETQVSAEVLLRDPAQADRVAKKLEELDLEVLSVGSRSVSIQGSKQRFESVFECRLIPLEAADSPARDFGPLGGRVSAPPNHPRSPASYET